MITRPIRFIQFHLNADHLYGLDEEGVIWYRDKVPWNNTTTYHGTTGGSTGATKKEEDEAKRVWKPLSMRAKVSIPEGGPMREAQPAEIEDADLIEEEGKIYTDKDTIAAVQTVLKDQNFYRYNIDGDLGPSTKTGIKNFRKEKQMPEGEFIDDALLRALNIQITTPEPVTEIKTETTGSTPGTTVVPDEDDFYGV